MRKWFLLFGLIGFAVIHSYGQCNPAFTYQADTNNFVNFINQTPQNSAFSYQWDFGDGSPIDTNYSPSHQYAYNGSFIVTLSVDSGTINCGNILDTAYVNFCNAYFTTQVSNNVVQFLNYSSASSSSFHYWDFGDGNYSAQKNPSHTYQFAGRYAVKLDVYDSLSSCFTTYIDSVNVSAAPCRAGFSYTTNQDTLFIQNQANNYQSIHYDFGDSTFSSINNPIHIYNQSGTYIVCQTVTDSLNNCNDTFCDTINITIPPACVAGYAYSTSDDSLFIQNQATNYQTIEYDFGDSTKSNLPNPIHIYQQSGQYLVCQTIRDTLNNCSDTFCDTVTINIPPACSAAFNHQINEDTLSIQNAALNYQKIRYDFGDGNSSQQENPKHIYSQSGFYQVCQTVEDTLNNCVDVFCDSISITVPSPCNAGFTYQFSGDTTLFQNTATNFDSLIYFFGDGNSSTLENPAHEYVNSGQYIVEQKVFNHRNCIASYKDTIWVTISTSCVAQFQLALDTSKPSTLYLVNNSSSDLTHEFYWDFGDGNSSFQKNPTHQYAENKAYPICLTVSDTSMNCTSLYCDTVGLDSNGNVLKSAGFTLKVIDGSAIGIVEKKNPLNQLKLFPNPAHRAIKVKWPLKINQLIYSIYNTKGQQIKVESILHNEEEINLEKLNPGIYWIHFKYIDHQTVYKIIKL